MSLTKKLILPLIATGILCSGTVQYNKGYVHLPKVGDVCLTDKIVENGHFSWGEATNNGERIPQNDKVVDNIVKTAYKMEEVRNYLGSKPIKINSWYRDSQTNKKIGGEKNSQHILGDAVDFVVVGMKPSEVYNKLDAYNQKGGLGKYNGFTHFDIRGYKARWQGK